MVRELRGSCRLEGWSIADQEKAASGMSVALVKGLVALRALLKPDDGSSAGWAEVSCWRVRCAARVALAALLNRVRVPPQGPHCLSMKVCDPRGGLSHAAVSVTSRERCLQRSDPGYAQS
jgi:hypothetical protein